MPTVKKDPYEVAILTEDSSRACTIQKKNRFLHIYEIIHTDVCNITHSKRFALGISGNLSILVSGFAILISLYTIVWEINSLIYNRVLNSSRYRIS